MARQRHDGASVTASLVHAWVSSTFEEYGRCRKASCLGLSLLRYSLSVATGQTWLSGWAYIRFSPSKSCSKPPGWFFVASLNCKVLLAGAICLEDDTSFFNFCKPSLPLLQKPHPPRKKHAIFRRPEGFFGDNTPLLNINFISAAFIADLGQLLSFLARFISIPP